jgi:hypothetical protein
MRNSRNYRHKRGFGSTPVTSDPDAQFYVGKGGDMYVQEPNKSLTSTTDWLNQPVGYDAMSSTSGGTTSAKSTTFQYDPKSASDAVNSRIGINSGNLNTVIASSTTAKQQRDAAMQPILEQVNQYNEWKAAENAKIEQSPDYLSQFKFDSATGVYLPVSKPPETKKNNTLLYVGLAGAAALVGTFFYLNQSKRKK